MLSVDPLEESSLALMVVLASHLFSVCKKISLNNQPQTSGELVLSKSHDCECLASSLVLRSSITAHMI